VAWFSRAAFHQRLLEGLQSQSKGIPKIEASFNIGRDCVLEVKAREKSTGKSRT
jgi:molecular chaperone DnaK (HSP70)